MSYKNSDHDSKIEHSDPNFEEKKGSITERLSSLLRGRSLRAVAKDWGIPLSTVTAYVSKGSIPSVDKAYQIANAENVTVEWLVTGEERSQNQIKNNEPFFKFLKVPKFGVLASAGGGSYIEEECIEEYYPFSDEYLRRNRLSHADLLVVEAKGDSMAPCIESGDDLLLKRVEFNADNVLSGVHVISIDGMLKVKRLQYSLQRNGYRIISDNPEYPEEFIDHEELMQDRMRVVGEVVMIMGKPNLS
ncbi:TPA: XRE family transcriptional regulator [Vibrio parahaemolyticus]